jgi:hypothetical protein
MKEKELKGRSDNLALKEDQANKQQADLEKQLKKQQQETASIQKKLEIQLKAVEEQREEAIQQN